MAFLIWLLAFCLVVPIHFANAKVSPIGCPASATDGIHLPHKNKTIVKPYNKDNATERDGGDEDKTEIKQFIHELFDQYNTLAAVLLYKDGEEGTAIDYSKIEAVLYHGDQKQEIHGQEFGSNIEELVGGIKKINLPKTEKKAKNVALLEGTEVLKIIEHLDNATSILLRDLHRSITDIIGIFNAGKIIQNAKLQSLKNAIVDTVTVLAKHLNIPTNEIIQLEKGPQIEPKNVLKELAQFWRHQKEQNGKNSENSDEKRQHQQRNKRMLKLIMDFTVDGIDGLANLKMKKKSRGRRRRKRGGADKGFAIAFVVFLLGAFVIYCCVHYANKNKSNEDKTNAISDIEAQIQPERRESPNRPNRRPRSRSSSHSRERLRANLNHSSSRGDPDRNSMQRQLDVDYYSSGYRNAAQETFEPPRDSNYHGDNERKGRKSRRENSQERKHRNNGRRRSGSGSRNRQK
ncbi:hypothetical protein niasHT_012054 [Heterodera trifolii]|uniref:Uncharacterized protein n=1 Tax=Heterodera trifolii TaxID=157864 RepID=A0ABD2LA30_9BILA